MKQIGEQTSKLAYLNEKLTNIQNEKLKTEEQRADQDQTLQELRGKMAKLQQIASSYGINLDTYDDETK